MLSDRELLEAVQGAADDYTVFGELGRQGNSLAALLARERANRRLVVLMVQTITGAGGETELTIEVKDQLDARIPDGGTKCPACSATLRPWVRFCTRCGHDVTGQGAGTPADRDGLRSAVVAAVESDYEYLGEMRRSEGGGDVFFARERSSGRIAALRLNRGAAEGDFELGETNILRKAPAPKPVVSVTQILRRLEPDAGPSAAHADQPYAPPTPRPAAPPMATPSKSLPPSPPSPSDSRLPLSSRAMLLTFAVVVALIALLTILVLR
ncbi:MAG: hypothetical protein ABIW79_03130 [Gemmatimonas sp.]